MKRFVQLCIKRSLLMGVFFLLSGKLFAYTAPTALQVLWPGTDQTSTCHNYGDYITNVTFAGINNTTAGSGAKAWHSDFGRSPQIAAGEVTIGQSYSFSVTLAGPDYAYDYVAVYVDWNQNNVNGTTGGTTTLDTNENPLVWNGLTGSGSKTLTGSITVPTGISTGLIYMRVMIDCDSNNPASGDFTCGIGYGEFQDYVLNVSAASVAPTVTTQAVSSITATTATGNGNITSLGSPNPTVSGICWNTATSPTTSNFKTTDGPTGVTGAFTGSMTSLSANTTYYVRAYATNTAGTSYGSEVSFTTSPIAPTVTTQAVSSIAVTTATGNGNITSLGVPNPTAYGVCWNTGGTPTTSDSKNDKGAASATGAFTASMTGLTASTTYHVRAFATNAAGTSYGTEQDFTTSTATPTVSGISPTSGPTTGGTSVTITGTNLTGASAVRFGATNATGYTVNSATQITSTSPAGSAGAVDVTVTTAGGTSTTSASDQFTYTAAPTTSTFTGTGNWSTAARWDNGLPGTTMNAIIAGTCTVDANYTVTNLTINNGNIVTVGSGKILTVSGTLTNNAGTSGLLLASDATGMGMLMNNSTGVQATIQQFLTKDVWHFIGIPVSYVSDANNVYHNCYLSFIDESYAYNSSNTGWEYLNTGNSLTRLHGYAVKYDKGSNDNDTTIIFSGILNTGVQDTIFDSENEGWNFISNPYPVTIDWDASGGKTLSNSNDAFYVWHPDLNSGSGGYGSYGSYVSGGSTNGQTQYIAPMQGFFFEVWATNAGISFNNSSKKAQSALLVDSRTVSPSGKKQFHPFYTDAKIEDQSIKLAVTDNGINYDETLIRVNKKATYLFDSRSDAAKLKAIDSKLPQLFSVTDGREYSINTIPKIDEKTLLPLKVMIKSTGKHTLVLKEFKHFRKNYPLILYDESGNSLANLEEGSCEFEGKQGEVKSFYLGFGKTDLKEISALHEQVKQDGAGISQIIIRPLSQGAFAVQQDDYLRMFSSNQF